MFCGKNLSDQRKNLQLGAKVVLNMLDAVEELQYHTVFFVNFFTSYPLVIYSKV